MMNPTFDTTNASGRLVRSAMSRPIKLKVIKDAPTFKTGITHVCVVQQFTGRKYKPGFSIDKTTGKKDWADKIGEADERVAVMSNSGLSGCYHVFESMVEADQHFEEIA